MTNFINLLPALIGLLILGLYLLAIKMGILKNSRWFSKIGYGFLVMFFTAIVLLCVWWVFFLDAKPTANFKNKIMEANTALIFGFGYEENCCGKMLPGVSNSELYEQAINDAEYQYLIMQEGVMVAAPNDGLRNIQMHPHTAAIHINTIEAAKYAILKMDSLNEKKAIVYAHSDQLARAVYDLKRVAASNPKWQDFEFITPAIPPTSYPRKSVQKYTRFAITYVPMELFYMRPRDTLYKLSWLKDITLTNE